MNMPDHAVTLLGGAAEAYLAKAGRLLLSSLDYDQTLNHIAQVALPLLGDCCAIDLLAEGSLQRVQAAHMLPEKQAADALPQPPLVPEPSAGQATLLVPLVANQRHIGVLSLSITESERRYSQSDLALAQEVAAMAAQALDHARRLADAEAASKRNEEALALLDMMVQSAPYGIALLDRNLRYLMINEPLARLNGLPAQAHIGHTPRELFPELAEPLEQIVDQVLATGQPIFNLERTGPSPKTPDQLQHWQLSFYPAYTGSGELMGVGAIVQDTTERKQAEAQQRESEDRFRALFTYSPDAVVLIDPRGDWPIVDCNDAACHMNGYSREELIGQSINLLNGKNDEQSARVSYLEQIRREGILQFEDIHVRKDGTRFPVEISTSIVTLGGRELVLGHDRDITARKQAQEALRQSEERFRATFEQAAVGVAHVALSGHFLRVNQRLCDMGAYTRDEMLALSFQELVMPESSTANGHQFRQLLANEVPSYTGERCYRRKDGSPIWIQLTVSLVRDATGAPEYLMAVAEDISERRETVAALTAAESRYRALVEQIPAVIFTAEAAPSGQPYRISYVSPYIQPILGFTPEEWMDDPQLWMRQIHPNDRAWLLEQPIHPEPVSLEHRMLTRDGRIRWFQNMIWPVYNGQHALPFFQGILMDITERKRAEQRSQAFATLGRQLAAATTAKSAAQIVAAVADGLLGWDAFMLNLYSPVTDTGRYVLSYDTIDSQRIEVPLPSEFTPTRMSRSVFADGPQIILRDVTLVQNSNLEPFGNEQRRSASLLFVPIRNGETSVGVLSIQSYTPQAYTHEDLATLQALADHCGAAIERIEVAESLYESEQRFRTLVTHAPVGIFECDGRGVYEYGNDQALQMIGISHERAMREGWAATLHPADQERVFREWSNALETADPFTLEYRFLQPNGNTVWVSGKTVPLYDQTNTVTGYLGTAIDITERKQAETALEEERALLAQRVEERTADLSAANAALAQAARLKDEFLASMSHELRTPLNAVLGLSEALREQVYGTLTNRQDRALQTIEESGRHLLELINDILDLAKIGAGKLDLEMEQIVIEQLSQASLRIVQEAAAKKRLALELTIDPQAKCLMADARRLKQILVNLLSNAVKFTPEGGSVGLDVTFAAANQQIQFTVWDTGIGIAPEQINRLFQPFVQLDGRLARQYEGTGLGLALVSSMASLHGGHVTVESQLGVGSRFTVSLPWRALECPPRPPHQTSQQPQPVV